MATTTTKTIRYSIKDRLSVSRTRAKTIQTNYHTHSDTHLCTSTHTLL